MSNLKKKQTHKTKNKKLGGLFFPNLLLTITLSTSSILKQVWDSKTSKSRVGFHPNHTEDQAYVCMYTYIYTHLYTCTHHVCMCVCAYVHTHIHTWCIYICMYVYTYTHTHTDNVCENIEQIKLPDRLRMTMLCTFCILNMYVKLLEIKKDLTDILSTGIFHCHCH